MKLNFNRNNIIIGITIIVLLGAVGYYFLGNGGTQVDYLTSVQTTDASDSDLITTLGKIESISLNENIFSDPVFVRLTDFSQPLVSQGNPGRSNPFAPLGNDLSPVGSPVKTTR